MSAHRPTQRTTTGSIRVQNDSARELRAFERAKRWSASEARESRDRLKQRIFPMLQASIGAGISWYVARELFGHEAPIFAGVVAVVCLGMNFGNRLTRAVEITAGAATGILTGELIVHFLGTGAWQTALIALLAMVIATFAGAGSLLTIQAGVQGVVVATATILPGGALSRWIDAVIGGLVAIAIAMVTPTSPLRKPRRMARRLTQEVARLFDRTAHGLSERNEQIVGEALRDARFTDHLLGELRSQVEEGAAIARTVPWQWRKRTDLRGLDRQLTAFDRLLRNARVLVRRADVAILEGEPVPSSYVDLVAEAADIASDLAKALDDPQALGAVRRQLGELAELTNHRAHQPSLSAEVIRAQVRSAIVDMYMVTGLSYGEARVRVPSRYHEVQSSEDG
ncbi:aromatic acid exporter family protein [Kytococcus sedentarius]|uniref:FUSC family protein n=1 Tax=Kytococcus sedentarius TaxID=1276 RepID=UPI0035BBDAA3